MIVNNVPLLSPVFGSPGFSSVVVVSEETDGAVDVVVVSEDEEGVGTSGVVVVVEVIGASVVVVDVV